MKRQILGLLGILVFSSGVGQAYVKLAPNGTWQDYDPSSGLYSNGQSNSDKSLYNEIPSNRERTYYHSDGSKTLQRDNGNGHGTIYHSDGSKSIY